MEVKAAVPMIGWLDHVRLGVFNYLDGPSIYVSASTWDYQSLEDAEADPRVSFCTVPGKGTKGGSYEVVRYGVLAYKVRRGEIPLSDRGLTSAEERAYASSHLIDDRVGRIAMPWPLPAGGLVEFNDYERRQKTMQQFVTNHYGSPQPVGV